MYICEECGAMFEQPRITYESHPYGEGWATEEGAVCPCCGEGGLFPEAIQCEYCGEYFALKDVDYIGQHWYCEVCSDDLFG